MIGLEPVTRDERRSELGIAAVPVLLTLLTIFILFDPRMAPAIVSQPLDLVITATAVLVALAVMVKVAAAPGARSPRFAVIVPAELK